MADFDGVMASVRLQTMFFQGVGASFVGLLLLYLGWTAWETFFRPYRPDPEAFLASPPALAMRKRPLWAQLSVRRRYVQRRWRIWQRQWREGTLAGEGAWMLRQN